jgi:hypothetical protein
MISVDLAVFGYSINQQPDIKKAHHKLRTSGSVNKQISTREPDYWDYATLLELAILDGDRRSAGKALSQVLASVRESWQAETTADNLDQIATARKRSGDDA